jgi:hypothetical protein
VCEKHFARCCIEQKSTQALLANKTYAIGVFDILKQPLQFSKIRVNQPVNTLRRPFSESTDDLYAISFIIRKCCDNGMTSCGETIHCCLNEHSTQ